MIKDIFDLNVGSKILNFPSYSQNSDHDILRIRRIDYTQLDEENLHPIFRKILENCIHNFISLHGFVERTLADEPGRSLDNQLLRSIEEIIWKSNSDLENSSDTTVDLYHCLLEKVFFFLINPGFLNFHEYLKVRELLRADICDTVDKTPQKFKDFQHQLLILFRTYKMYFFVLDLLDGFWSVMPDNIDEKSGKGFFQARRASHEYGDFHYDANLGLDPKAAYMLIKEYFIARDIFINNQFWSFKSDETNQLYLIYSGQMDYHEVNTLRCSLVKEILNKVELYNLSRFCDLRKFSSVWNTVQNW